MPKVTLSATIPCQQYGNLSPTFEVEADTHAEAMEIALDRMKQVWDATSPKPLQIRKPAEPQLQVGEELDCWASGTKVRFDRENHHYLPVDGKPWLSGSAFAHRYKGEFNAPVVAAKMAAKANVIAGDIVEMWELNRDASSTVGSAVHQALQLRGEYGDLSKRIKGTYESALTKNPILLPIVESFFEGREDEDAEYEVFVADPARMHCGFIDRLVILPSGHVIVEDYKTNSEIHKSETIKAPFKGVVENSRLGAYWLQLSFYARILTVHGYPVDLLRVHWWDGDCWVQYEREPIDLDGAFK